MYVAGHSRPCRLHPHPVPLAWKAMRVILHCWNQDWVGFVASCGVHFLNVSRSSFGGLDKIIWVVIASQQDLAVTTSEDLFVYESSFIQA